MNIVHIQHAILMTDVYEIRRAFRWLVNYPKEGEIAGLEARNAMSLLDGLVQKLWGDYEHLPRETCDALNLIPVARYCDAATTVANNRQRFVDHFSMIFRGH